MLAAVTAQLLFLVDLIDSKGSCAVKTLSQCNTFFVRVSIYTNNLIGYDRYLRVQYPVIYQELMLPFHIYVMSFLIWVFASLNTLTICISFYWFFSVSCCYLFPNKDRLGYIYSSKLIGESEYTWWDAKNNCKISCKNCGHVHNNAITIFVLNLLKGMIMDKPKETEKRHLEFTFQL